MLKGIYLKFDFDKYINTTTEKLAETEMNINDGMGLINSDILNKNKKEVITIVKV